MVAEHRERLKQADGRPDHRFTSGELHWAGTALLCHLPRSVTGWEHAVETVALAPTLQRSKGAASGGCQADAVLTVVLLKAGLSSMSLWLPQKSDFVREGI